MKRTERHHLKEDPLVAGVLAARQAVVGRGATGIIAGVIVAVLVVVGGLYGWQQLRLAQSGELLATAMAVLEAPVANEGEGQSVGAGSYSSIDDKLEAALPLLRAAAEEYPSLPAGIVARYQSAALLVTLGRAEEAQRYFEQVAELDPDGVYGNMARLGRAEALLSNGDYDQAIVLLEAEVTSSGVDIPVDAVLMRLGIAYQLSNQQTEAISAYTRLLNEFPASQYRFDAESELDSLSGGG